MCQSWVFGLMWPLNRLPLLKLPSQRGNPMESLGLVTFPFGYGRGRKPFIFMCRLASLPICRIPNRILIKKRKTHRNIMGKSQKYQKIMEHILVINKGSKGPDKYWNPSPSLNQQF